MGYSVGYIETGEWLQFTVNSDETKFDIDIGYSNASERGKITIEDEAGVVLAGAELPLTGGKEVWKTITVTNIALKKGSTKLKIKFGSGGFNLHYFNFTKAK